MSITQEYKKNHAELGEETFKDIERFLDYHPEYLLNNLDYNEAVWEKFETWSVETPKELKEAEPIYAVTCINDSIVNCFFGTKDEILNKLGIGDTEFERYMDEWRSVWDYRKQIALEMGGNDPSEIPFHMGLETNKGWYHIEVLKSTENLKNFLRNAYFPEQTMNFEGWGVKGLQIAKEVHASLDKEIITLLAQSEKEVAHKNMPLDQKIQIIVENSFKEDNAVLDKTDSYKEH